LLIRSEHRRWHARTRFCIHSDKNFLFAKIPDSEFAHVDFIRAMRVEMRVLASEDTCMRVTNVSVAQGLSAILTIADVDGARIFDNACRSCVEVVLAKQAFAATRLRQHFLKRDTVFFEVLVYAGKSASRFPNARSD
jgi:hypothetical protein